jgi:hypothetical protein
MFSLGAWLALEITTSTPDALCPPLDEAREVIAARVGEVLGRYRVEYALLRSEDGARALRLEVRLDEQPVLQRELPLNHSGCEDAAQTIALVLERYFDAIERPAIPSTASKREPVPETVERGMSQLSPPATTSAHAIVSPPRPRPVRAGAGLLLAHDLGFAPSLSLELRPAWLRPARHIQLGWGLSLAPFVASHTQVVREQEISEKTLQIATWLPVELDLGSWALWLGPWAQLRIQRAQAASLAQEQPGYRGLPGLGGAAGLGWSPSGAGAGLTISLSGALGTQLVGSGARFALRAADGSKTVVLVPETTFSQVGLGLALTF